MKDTSPIRRIQERQYAVFKIYGNTIFWKISNVVPTPRNSNTPYPTPWIRRSTDNFLVIFQLRMTKVIKGEFEKLEDLNDKDVLLIGGTSLEVFNKEFNRMSGMDNDLFTYKVEVANIPCDSNKDDDSEQRVSHEADDDMGYDPSDIRGDDGVELTDEEFYDNEDEVAKVFRIDTNIFNFETPMCKAFKEFNYLLQIDPDLLTKDTGGFKTYEEYKDYWIYEWNRDVPWVDEKPWTDTGVWTEPTPVKHYCKPFNYKTGCSEWPTCSWRNDGFCNGGNLPGAYIIRNSLHYQDYEWYEALKDSELKEDALRNKVIMEGLIDDDNDDESRFEMIYSFEQDDEYVAVKEDEYDDLARTSDDACRAYQEIFRMMDEGWMDPHGTLNLKAYFEASHINNSKPRKEKDLGSFTLPCFINNICFDNALVDLGASVSVMPLSTYLNLGLGELAYAKLIVELADKIVKYPKGIAENVLVGIDKFVFPADFYNLEIMELDLEARLMGETLVINRSLDPLNVDYIELNDLNKPFELRRNQGDDLMPTIEEGEVIEEFKTRDDELDTRIDDYPRALMNVPIFVGTFSVVTDFAVLEDMDAYRDEGMGDVIFGEPFLREVGIKARRFEGNDYHLQW
ncbi:VIER F-box protein 2 [Tanacetum coccineum]